jgi:hypothetical protein
VNSNSTVLKALHLARHNKKAQAVDRCETGRWLAKEGHKSSKEFGRVEEVGRLHGTTGLLEGQHIEMRT